MFKRANKMTSLLVAAAAVVSLVPASAADVKKVDSEDGTIYNAVAYADGKAYVDGEVNDDEAAYYVADGEFTALEDVDSGDDAVLYGEKYVNIEDGDYALDLDAGTVTDDDIVEDTVDDAASALRKNIKDDTEDRYTDVKTDAGTTDEVKSEGTTTYDLKKIPGAKYGAVWYETKYAQASGKSVNDNDGTNAPDLSVFVDTDGNYIDADYNLGKIKVTTTASGVTGDKSVNIENTNDGYDDAAGNETITASVSNQKVIAQDADYIYRIVDVTVKTSASGVSITEINGVDISKIDSSKTSVFNGDAKAYDDTVTFQAIQKISKEADSDDVDGANYAKTVVTYVASNDKGVAVDSILTTAANYTVAGGKLIAYNIDSDKEGLTARAYTLKSSSGYYYADEEDASSEDTEKSDDQGAAVQVDVDGNLWRLDGGYIYKFDNTDDWDKVYKVDGSIDELSVYDADNIIAWSEDDEVYSVIGGEAADDTTDGDTTVETPAVTTGWVSTATGWTFYDATGSQVKGQWVNAGGVWYYIKADGIMATGWYNDNGTWYYLNASGAMQTGWLNDNGTWYYLNASGAMLANTTVDGYVLGASGAWVK